jgi:hypothetical protein
MELLFDHAYLSKVVDEKKSWFTRMEVVDLIYHQSFFTANSLGCQSTTSQYVKPLTWHTLALAASAIRFALSEYSGGQMATVMFCHDKYRGTFCASRVIKFSPEATTLDNYTLMCCLMPPSVMQLRVDRDSSIPVGAPQRRWTLIYFILHLKHPIGCSIPTGAPWSELSLLYLIPHSCPHTPPTLLWLIRL